MTSPSPAASTPVRSGRIEVNGVDYYWEVHGRGEPLLLLHGGLGSIEMFGPVLPMLAEHREVIGVDLHGHGRTTLGDREISLVDMGDDMAAGAAMAEMMKDTPMYQSYAALAPNPGDFPRLLDRMGEAMRREYDWADDVKTLRMPVMLVYGDSDMFRPEHVVRFYQLLGGGLRDAGWMREHMSQNRLAILPDLTHYEMFCAPALATTVLPFLDGESGARSWAEQVAQGG